MSLRDSLHRLIHFEYWPFWAFYLPVFAVWPLLSWRGRSFLFFTTANPCIPHGGCFGESKHEILKLLPYELVPATKFISGHPSIEQIENWMQEHGLAFPLIAKPDVGERGDHIEVLYRSMDVRRYSKNLGRPFILQAFLHEPVEYGVMVVRSPLTGACEITSVVAKDFLSLRGDGKKTVEELIRKSARARFQWERLQDKFDGKRVLADGETLILEPIGNHKRGTTFLNANFMLTPELEARFQQICESITGFNVGRFDVKASSAESFSRGQGIKVMELNGVFSEPGHIYDPSAKLLNSWRDLVRYWFSVAEISRQNIQRGHSPTKLADFFHLWTGHRNLRRNKASI